MSELQDAITRNIRVIQAVRGMRGDRPIANILGISVSTVSKKMNGERKWTIPEVEELAAALGINAAKFFGEAQSIVDPGEGATGTMGSTKLSSSGHLIQFPAPSGLLTAVLVEDGPPADVISINRNHVGETERSPKPSLEQPPATGVGGKRTVG